MSLPLAQRTWELRKTPTLVVTEIDTLLDKHTEGEITVILNKRGRLSGEGKAFHANMVKRIRRDYHLKTRFDRLREAGLLTLAEVADLLGVATGTVKNWCRYGLLRSYAYNDKNECLYEHPGEDHPVKAQGRKLTGRRRFPEVIPNHMEEVQCEA